MANKKKDDQDFLDIVAGKDIPDASLDVTVYAKLIRRTLKQRQDELTKEFWRSQLKNIIHEDKVNLSIGEKHE